MIKQYFVGYKLNVLTGSNETDAMITTYRNDFLSYVGVAAQIPNVLCNAANLFMQSTWVLMDSWVSCLIVLTNRTGSITYRVTAAILTESGIFITTVALALVDSSKWPLVFFYVTLLSVILLNMANGIYQNCVYGLAAKLPMKYSGAVVFGSNISGVITSIISITSVAIAASAKTAAVYYFLTALFVLFLCLDTYFLLPLCVSNNFSRFLLLIDMIITLQKYFRHFETLNQRAASSTDSSPSKSVTEGTKRARRPNYLLIFKEIWPQCLNVFTIFFVTLSIFPAVHAKISSTGSLSWLTPKYFSQVTCFLTFNVTAMIGNLIPTWIIYPAPDKLWIPVFARFLLIPFFMLCNYSPETREWPVLIESDYLYLLAGAVLGLSSGYLSSLAMMYAPKCVSDTENAPTAGMMAALFLILGISTGIFFSFFLSSLIEMSF